MKRMILGVTLMAALAAPAAAQYARGTDQDRSLDYRGRDGTNAEGDYPARIEQLRVRVRTGVQNGTISRQEGASLRQQIRQLGLLESQYGSNGLTSEERADLQDEIRDVRQQLRVAEGGAATGRDRYAEGDYSGQSPQTDRDGVTTEPVKRRTLGGIIDGAIGEKPN